MGSVLDGNKTPISAVQGESDFVEISEDDDDDEDLMLSIDDADAPIKADNKARNAFGGKLPSPKKDKKTAASHHMPNFNSMVGNKRPQDSMRKPYGSQKLTSFESFEREINKKVKNSPVMTADIASVLSNIRKSGLLNNSKSILNESSDLDESTNPDTLD